MEVSTINLGIVPSTHFQNIPLLLSLIDCPFDLYPSLKSNAISLPFVHYSDIALSLISWMESIFCFSQFLTENIQVSSRPCGIVCMHNDDL